MNRSEKIRIRLTERELSEVKKSADNHPSCRTKKGKVNLSNYCREALLCYAGIHDSQMRRDVESLRYELRKIGVNINQIAKKINSNIGTPEDVFRCSSYLDDIEELFQNFLTVVEKNSNERTGGDPDGNHETNAHQSAGESGRVGT